MTSSPMIPPTLAAMRDSGPGWSDWLDRLPALSASLLAEWRLTLDGPAWHGHCSMVLPVLTADQVPAALKMTFTCDEESEHEHLALRRWDGDGVVRLLRADPGRRALLLERLHDRDLSDEWDLQACETVAGLYARIHVSALPQLRPLT